jgi:hemoglobin
MSGAQAASETTTPYEMIGGAEAVRGLVETFYDKMDSDPRFVRLRAMHAGNLSPMRERLYEFLSGWLGGPALYARRPDAKCMMQAHAPFRIGAAERDEWLGCMRLALDETAMPQALRTAIDSAFSRMAHAMAAR